MFITIKDTSKFFKTTFMLKKHLFLPRYHFLELLSGLLDFCGIFINKAKLQIVS